MKLMAFAKKRFIESRAKALVFVGALPLVVGGCGATNDAGAELGLAVVPSKVYIVAGRGSSCVAETAAKTADAEFANMDVSGERVFFPSFRMQWRSPDELVVVGVRATISGRG
ncbi:MAG: hypothetical protein RBT63_11535, partial [Bdellovibrionales bacterium]|nr:hypothetical protein [Bdellovibrionales bacterium]